MRMCCGCHKRFEQRSLIRLQVSPQTQALTPVDTKSSGRSAWVCCNLTCIDNICKSPKRLNRSLRTQPKLHDFSSLLLDWVLQRLQLQFKQLRQDGVIKTERPIDKDSSGCKCKCIAYQRLEMVGWTLDRKETVSTSPKNIYIMRHNLRESALDLLILVEELKKESFR